LSKRLISSEPPKESEVSTQTLPVGAFSRSFAAAALVDETDRLVMTNEQAFALLRGMFPASDGAAPALDTLSDGFRAYARTLRHALETSALPILWLTAELLCRGSLLSGHKGSYMLVLFELGTRRTMVLQRLDAYDLTPREREVAELVLEGLTNRAVADRLTLTEHTVETHVKRILTKVDVHTRAAFVARILAFVGS
jgi:DNA-binding CsgD family transcriptional regulator